MFELRRRLVNDFSEYIRSFLKVRDDRIKGFVEPELNAGALWPQSLMGLQSRRARKGACSRQAVTTTIRHKDQWQL
jgi:hypothetical protein